MTITILLTVEKARVLCAALDGVLDNEPLTDAQREICETLSAELRVLCGGEEAV